MTEASLLQGKAELSDTWHHHTVSS